LEPASPRGVRLRAQVNARPVASQPAAAAAPGVGATP